MPLDDPMEPPMRRIALLALATAVLVLSACAADKRSQSLNTTLMRYASVVRWGDFTSALSFVDKDYLRDHPMSSIDQGRLAQLRVTSYDDGSGPQPAGDDEVIQVVQINVVNLNTQAERSIVDRQRWHYDKEKGTWSLMTGLPDFSPH
jgi:hypothetical protein